jgi:hypothetical protein
MHDLVVEPTARMAYETATDASVSHLASYPRLGNPTLMVMWRLHHNAYEHKIIHAWTHCKCKVTMGRVRQTTYGVEKQ